MDDSFSDRALAAKDNFGTHVVIGSKNYAQGSSREHAAIAPRNGDTIRVKNITQDAEYEVTHQMSPRQVKIMLAGGVINYIRQKA